MKIVRWMIAASVAAASAVTWAEVGTSQTQTGMVKEGTAAKSTGASSTSTEYDFGDFSSQTLTTNAWKALEAGEYAAVEAYTKKCISLYENQAQQQQASLTDFALKDKAFNYWALNDVGTSYFILGRAQLAQGHVKEAKEAFQTVIEKLSYAQCWDPKGWFWKVAVGARGRLNKILAETGS